MKKKKETRGRPAIKGSMTISTTSTPEIVEAAKANHGTIANAIRFAAKNKPSQNIKI